MRKVVNNLEIFYGHKAWSEVRLICENLTSHGFEALLAGGCVRDLVMSRVPKDFDVATNAKPDEILKFYPQALSVGREFGVIILAYEKFQIEIASFRRDGPYLDGRRPSQISFTTARQDALRRDFTVNALFLDLMSSQIIDYVGGLDDIESKLIRAVGNPQLRFSEDKLRMLRALRFSSELEFKIESETLAAIGDRHQDLNQVSSERIKDELTKWLSAQNLMPCLDGLWSTGILQSIHPNFKNLFDQGCFERLSEIFSQDLIKLSLIAKLCALFSFIIKKNQPDESRLLKQTLKDLKFSNEQIMAIHWCLTNYTKLLVLSQIPLSDQIELCANPSFGYLEEFLSCFNPSLAKTLKVQFEQLRSIYLIGGALPMPFLDGETLKALGLKPGREMGELLREVFRLQLEKKITSLQEALSYAERQLKD